MTDLKRSTVEIAAGSSRVLEKGQGPTLVFLAGIGGVPTWLPFLDELASAYRVVMPSLPGFPGASTGFHKLDDHLDWLTATLDLLEAANLEGADLVASSVAGMLAADVAAFSPAMVKRLVLLDPWGIYEPSLPGADVFATTPDEQPRLLVANLDRLAAAFARPDDVDELDWKVEIYRAAEAAARLSWPMGDRGLAKRLHRVRQRTLILWGEQDQVLPPAIADIWARGIQGPTEVAIVADAGHLCLIDQPEATAKEVASFLSS
jgi:pimeloyl-ACP methyl ester carboxylesterase